DLPAGETIRIESPSMGPTSNTCTCNSPVGFGGRVRSQGNPHFQKAAPPAPSTSTSTAITQPHPRVERFNVCSPEVSPSPETPDRLCWRPSALLASRRVVRANKPAGLSQHRRRARWFRVQWPRQRRERRGPCSAPYPCP